MHCHARKHHHFREDTSVQIPVVKSDSVFRNLCIVCSCQRGNTGTFKERKRPWIYPAKSIQSYLQLIMEFLVGAVNSLIRHSRNTRQLWHLANLFNGSYGHFILIIPVTKQKHSTSCDLWLSHWVLGILKRFLSACREILMHTKKWEKWMPKKSSPATCPTPGSQ